MPHQIFKCAQHVLNVLCTIHWSQFTTTMSYTKKNIFFIESWIEYYVLRLLVYLHFTFE